MVVGVLTTSYPRYAGDAAGSFVADQARRLSARGHEVEVLAAGDGPAGVSRTRDGDVTVTRVSTGAPRASSLFYGAGAPEVFERRGAAASIRAWLEAGHFTAALCREARAAAPRWDEVVSHWLVPCGLAASVVLRGQRHRAVAHTAVAHSGDVALLERLPFALGGSLARHLADSNAELVFVSQDLRRRFAALAGATVGRVERLAPDGTLFTSVSSEARAAARRRLGLVRPTVVAVGRLVPIKGFDLLLDAVGDLAEVVIIGAGPEAAALRARAHRGGVALRLPGFVARTELPEWLAAGDVYVQPSRVLPSGRSEGLPQATLEALAVGLPVIASRSGGLAELDSADGRISFFHPGDVGSLRGALVSALDEANRV